LYSTEFFSRTSYRTNIPGWNDPHPSAHSSQYPIFACTQTLTCVPLHHFIATNAPYADTSPLTRWNRRLVLLPHPTAPLILISLFFSLLAYTYMLLAPPLDYSVDCLTAPKPEPSRPMSLCVYVNDRKRQDTSEQPRVLPTTSPNTVNNRRLCAVRMVARRKRSDPWVAKCEERAAVPPSVSRDIRVYSCVFQGYGNR